MPRIEHINIRNFRVLQNLRLGPLEPFSVFLGPNGAGKTTLFRALGFLANCLQSNVRQALEGEGRFDEVLSRNQTGPIEIEIKYRSRSILPLLTYTLKIALDEQTGQPVVAREVLKWRRRSRGKPWHFLDFQNGQGWATPGEQDEQDDPGAERAPQRLDSPDILAVKGLGQMSDYPMVAEFRRFIEGWHLSYFMPTRARELPEAGKAAAHLSQTGDNLALVTQYLYDNHRDVFESILKRLAQRIPGLDSVESTVTEDSRVLLRFKDKPFEDPFVARFVSDGTIKMFAYLVLLNDPEPPPLLCIEEPENQLHPKLLAILAEEFRAHAAKTQVLVSSHSPYFVNALRPKELWWLQRDAKGYARATQASESEGVPEFLAEGLRLGDLWTAGHLGSGAAI